MGTTVSCWHHSPLDVTLEAKYPGSWKKMSMAQILHTNWPSTFSAFNYSHPGWFCVCKWLVLQPGEPHMPTMPWDPSNLSSLLLGGFGAAQKHLLFSLANPRPTCPLYLHVYPPFSVTVLLMTHGSHLQTSSGCRDAPWPWCELPCGTHASPPWAFFPGQEQYWSGLLGLLPRPKPTPGRRQEGFCFFAFLYNMFIIIVALTF